jgi:double-GTPase-like protein
VSDPAVLLIGGPETGKSNFLFRAWTHIFSGDGLVEKDGMPPDAEYLRDGAERQLRGEYAGHTSQEVQVISSIPVIQKGGAHNKALLRVPDIDGEQINRIYRDRKWSQDWESIVTENTAYLFFVRVNSPQTIAPLDWITCHELYGGAPLVEPTTEVQGSAPVRTEEVGDGRAHESVKNDETNVETPTQVVLVDWLQFILNALHSKYAYSVRPRVGIVVTGWDSVPSDSQGGPSEWIKDNMPLLYQFCVTNADLFDFSYFGSSIFSGDPENDPEFKEELAKKDPRTMGYVRYSTSNTRSGDFTIPIAWALGWESVP